MDKKLYEFSWKKAYGEWDEEFIDNDEGAIWFNLEENSDLNRYKSTEHSTTRIWSFKS